MTRAITYDTKRLTQKKSMNITGRAGRQASTVIIVPETVETPKIEKKTRKRTKKRK